MKIFNSSLNGSLAINTILLTGFGVLSAILGFLREVQIASYFALSTEADMYYLGMFLPELIVSVIGSASSNIYMRQYSINNRKKDYAKSVIFFLLCLVILITIILEIIFPYISNILAPGFNEVNKDQFIVVGRIMIFAILASVFFGIFTTTLNMNGKFILTGVTGVIFNVTLIISTFLLAPAYGIIGLAYSYLIGNILKVLILLPSVLSYFKGEISLKLAIPLLKEFPNISITNIVMSTQTYLERSFATILSGGAVAALNYAGKVSVIPNVLFMNSILTVMSPKMIEDYKNDKIKLEKSIKITVSIIFVGLVCAELFLMLFNKEITTIIFANGKFNKEDSDIVSSLILFYAPAVILSGISQVYIKVAYILGKTRLTLYCMLISLSFYIITLISLRNLLGVYGLAIGIIIYNVIMLISLIIGIRYGKESIKTSYKLKEWFNIFCIISLIIIFKYFLNDIYIINNILELAFTGIVYLIIFLFLIVIFERNIRTNLISYISNYIPAKKKGE